MIKAIEAYLVEAENALREQGFQIPLVWAVGVLMDVNESGINSLSPAKMEEIKRIVNEIAVNMG